MAAIMHGTWRCQMLRRIQNQPAEIKIVLSALSEALIAGKSEMDIVTTVTRLHCYNGATGKRFNIVTFVTLVTL